MTTNNNFSLSLNQPSFMPQFHDDRNRYLLDINNGRNANNNDLTPWTIINVSDDDDPGFVDGLILPPRFENLGFSDQVKQLLSLPKILNFIEDLEFHDHCNQFCTINHSNVYIEEDDMYGGNYVSEYNDLITIAGMSGNMLRVNCNTLCRGGPCTLQCNRTTQTMGASVHVGIENLRALINVNASVSVDELLIAIVRSFEDVGMLRKYLLAVCGDIESNPGPPSECDIKYLNYLKFVKCERARMIEAEREVKNQFLKPVSKPLNVKVNRRNLRKEFNVKFHGLGDYLRTFNSDVVADAAIASIPFVGTPLVAARNANKITSRLSNTLDTVNNMLDGIKKFFVASTSNIKADWLSNLRHLLFSLVNVYLAKPGCKIASFLLNLTNFSIDCGLSFSHFKPLMDYVLGGDQPYDVSFQSNIPASLFGQSQIAASGLVVILFSLMFKITGQVMDVTKAISFLGRLGKDLSGIKTLSKLLSETSESVMTWFRGDVLGLDSAEEIKSVIANIGLWLDEVRSLLVRMNEESAKERLLKDVQMILYVEELYKRGLEFSIDISNKRLSERVRFPFEQHMKLLTEIFKSCETSGAFGNRPRISPLVIWMFGDSGVGKSGVTWPLAIDLNNVILANAPEEERRNFVKHIYFRNVEQEFWDGYMNQNVVVYDDFGQMKDATGSPNLEFMEIIRTANISPYPLHMAFLEEKRKTKLTSKVVIMSSNKNKLNVNSLTHPDALDRRIDEKVEVCVLPKFAKTVYSGSAGALVTRLDIDKVREEFGDKVPIATQVYCFKIINPDDNSYTGEILNYAEFRDRCIRKLKARIGNSHELNRYLEKYAVGQHPDANIPYPDVKVSSKPSVLNPNVDEFIPSELLNVKFHVNMEEVEFVDASLTCETVASDYTYIPLTIEEMKNCLFKNINMYNEDGVNIMFEFSGLRTIEFNSNGDMLNTISSKYGGLYRRIRKSEKLETRLVEIKKNFIDSATEYYNYLVAKITEHPMMSALSVIGVVLAGFTLLGGWNWLFSGDDETVDDVTKNIPNVNKNAININDALFLKKFDIEKITSTKHDHIYISQCTADDLRTIQDLKLQKSFHIPKIALPEGNISGDNITKAKVNVKVESNPSGDVTTIKKNVVKVEGNPSGDLITRAKPNLKFESNVIDAELHMWKDTIAQTLINNRILGNLYRMVGKKGEETRELMNCLFVKGSIALVPTHVKAAFSMYDEISLINSFNVKFTVPTHCFEFIPITDRLGRNKEASLVYVNSSYISQHSDIVKHFTTSFEMGKWKAADVALPALRYSNSLKLMLPTILGNSEAQALDNDMILRDSSMPEGFQRMTLREGLAYKLNTRAGDCGSPVVVNEKQVLRKIAGIHVAGASDGTCFAESISKYDIERALREIDVKHQISLDLDLFNHKLHNIEYNTPEEFVTCINSLVPSLKFNPLGLCADPPASANKTELRPSLVSGSLTSPSTKPAYLNPTFLDGKLIDIKRKNLAKAAMDTPFIDNRKVNAAHLDVKRKLLKNIRPELRRILTFEEGIAGNRELSPYCEPVNRSSSPGYPWINDRNKSSKGKQQWLGDGDEYIYNEDVRDKVLERIALAKKGIRYPTVWVDTLKDERRPIEKVDAGKTRVFANGPMDFTILFRMYFLTFIAHIMENRIYNEQSIGTNTWSPDWARTAKYLQRKGKKVIAGDFSTFDGTLNSCIVGKFVECANEFYDDGPENALIRYVIFAEIFNSIHLCDFLFYMWTHSQPSGCPVTTPLNSYYNSTSMRIVYNDLAPPSYWNHFDDYCTMVSYGDDNVLNISDEIISWFNQLTISQGYGKIGMIYTDEGKTGEMVEYRRLDEIKYLKRNFEMNMRHGVWKAPLDLDTILEMTNWIRGDLDQKASTLENCGNAIRELSQHSESIFNKYVPLINRACLSKCQDTPSQSTYADYWEECLIAYYS